MTTTLYLIGGPMGVGKTAVCRELNHLLPRSVMLDGDWCWYANPFEVTPETKALVLDNISHVLGNFLRCSVYENVILCWVMHEQGIVDEILGSLPLAACDTTVRHLSLVASEAALRARIEQDVAAGLRDAGAVARSLDYLPRYRSLTCELIDTTDRTPHEIARAIAGVDRAQ